LVIFVKLMIIMRNLTIPFLLFSLCFQLSKAQLFDLSSKPSSEPPKPSPAFNSSSETPNFIYKNEFSGQLMVASRGLGFNIRRAQNLTIEKKKLFEFDLAYINHPKEFKVKARNNDWRNAKNYYYGKINSCAFLRGGIGFQNRLYRRGDRKSIEIRYNTVFGLSAAFLKPVYVYLYPKDDGFEVESVKHDPSTQANISQVANGDRVIIGRASYFEGINKMKIVPGAYAKFSGMIEYGNNPQELKAIEIGVIADGFLRPLDIMKFYNQEQIVVSIYASIVFGKKWF
jgi:hypothetical protein